MLRPKGRSDDMLIIRGVNVFPAQVEHVIHSLGMDPNYQIIVDRANNLDIITVCIEMSDHMFSDSVKQKMCIRDSCFIVSAITAKDDKNVTELFYNGIVEKE